MCLNGGGGLHEKHEAATWKELRPRRRHMHGADLLGKTLTQDIWHFFCYSSVLSEICYHLFEVCITECTCDFSSSAYIYVVYSNYVSPKFFCVLRNSNSQCETRNRSTVARNGEKGRRKWHVEGVWKKCGKREGGK